MSVAALLDRFPGAGVESVDAPDGMPTVYVPLAQLPDIAIALRDELGFLVLIDLVPVDLHPREPRFEISYLLLNPGAGGVSPARLRVKVRVPRDTAQGPTVSHVWASANWAEREAYDFFGITFDGHADLRRILMPEDWEGFPMRKDYPVQIKQPVKTYEPLQLTEEQFVANIEASKEQSRKG